MDRTKKEQTTRCEGRVWGHDPKDFGPHTPKTLRPCLKKGGHGPRQAYCRACGRHAEATSRVLAA